ncbi:MAG: aldehyde:ferredoxin oxidoreductase [Planctomycetaceae bacterium]|jgi:aldehyde:ferredoxin oxidoreductase|nr:aldehyde:ferredoxin oxidoreductase [Planctomycetaceae bacterium]
MTVLHGYHGCYLRIDLSGRTSEVVNWPEGVLRRFLGGTGLGTWLLLRETPGQIDPLAAEVPLVFVFSPLVDSPLTTSAKFAVLAKSPLTGRINDSLASSHFAIAGKRTGHDAIVIHGAAEAPTCVVVSPNGVEFVSGEPYWGRSSRETEAGLQDRLGKEFRVAAIGPAGEALVHFATISHEGRHAGRGGLGAVMGSKRVKAVAVAGDRRVTFADPDRLLEISRDLSQRSLGPATAKYRELGTIDNLLTFNRLGSLPTRNFQRGFFEEAEMLAAEMAVGDGNRTQKSCASCTIGCEHIFRFKTPLGTDGETKDPATDVVRMEYENLFALGPLCGISDPDTVLAASARCDELGLDTISAGATVAFAMECVERGLLEVPGLRFGNGEALLAMIDDIGRRRGWGELLAGGTRAAAESIGGGSAAFAPHVKGLEIPGYEPRALQTMALGFAVGTRGADHNRSGAYEVDFSPEVNRLDVGSEAIGPAVRVEDEAVLMDSLILCKFLRGVFEDRIVGMAELIGPVTGWDVTARELRKTASRIVTAKKVFNISQGWTPAEDTLPQRFFEEPLETSDGGQVWLEESRLAEQVRDYNLARGWLADGHVPNERLVALGLANMT